MKYLVGIDSVDNLSYKDLDVGAQDLNTIRDRFVGDFQAFVKDCPHNTWVEIPSCYVGDSINRKNFIFYLKKIADTVDVKTDITFKGCYSSTPWERPVKDIIPVKWYIEGETVTNPDTGICLGKMEDKEGKGEVLVVPWDKEDYLYLYVLPHQLATAVGKTVVTSLPTGCYIDR